jgi:hypothetical protein
MDEKIKKYGYLLDAGNGFMIVFGYDRISHGFN